MFVDRAEIEVSAGDGGNGCVSFRRERYIPRGGPDGGDGGNGGDVIIVAKDGVDSLSALSHRRFWKADRGVHGQGANKHGRQGKGLTIEVPPGTVVRDLDGKFVLKDLAGDGDQVVAARGGRGGRGNAPLQIFDEPRPTRGHAGGRRRDAEIVARAKNDCRRRFAR